MIKALVLCYSTTGNTRLVGDRIAQAMGEEGVEATVRDPVRERVSEDLSSWDIVGFGTPTMAWKPSRGVCEGLGLVPSPSFSSRPLTIPH